MAKRWEEHTPKGKKLPKYVKKKKRKKTKAEYMASIVRIASLRRQGFLDGDISMSLQDIKGFDKYTPEVITELRHMFGDEIIDSRPIKLNNVVMWVNANEVLHRTNGPAVERADGSCEYWNNGIHQTLK